jgi:hypothetical protein
MTDTREATSKGARRKTGLAITDAPELLSDIGYLLVHGSPFQRGPAYLLVAIRPRPTRAHFDPERIEYWCAGSGAAQPATLEWPFAVPPPAYSWGTIKVIDRVAAVNRFVSFGGSLSGARDGALSAALFRSDAPILAVSGRGEAGDPLAASVLGFFARLAAACGADSALARHVSAMDALALYAAYLMRTLDLYSGGAGAPTAPPRLRTVLRSELCLLGRDSPPSADGGEALVRRLERADQQLEGVPIWSARFG